MLTGDFLTDAFWSCFHCAFISQITILNNVTVDVFITHTAADPDQRYHNYSNAYYRDRQVKELMDSYVKKSTADVVLLGGDFNAGPDFTEGEKQ